MFFRSSKFCPVKSEVRRNARFFVIMINLIISSFVTEISSLVPFIIIKFAETQYACQCCHEFKKGVVNLQNSALCC